MLRYDCRIPVLDVRAWVGPVRLTVWTDLYATALLSLLVKNVMSAKVSKPRCQLLLHKSASNTGSSVVKSYLVEEMVWKLI